MANKKITELTLLTSAASDDVLAIVDVSGTAETKKITVANLTGGLTTIKVTLSNADVLAMKWDNTPITLKAAEPLKIVVPVSCVCVATHGGSDESSSDDLRLGWDAGSSQTDDRWGEARDWMNSITTGTISTCFGGPSSAGSGQIMTFSLTNSPFQIWCTDVFNGGWTMEVYFSYYMAHI